jgi:hypothetical protein
LSKVQVEQLKECRERWKGVGFRDFAMTLANSRRSRAARGRRAAAISSNKKADDGEPSSAI